jgi:hypothetical protein
VSVALKQITRRASKFVLVALKQKTRRSCKSVSVVLKQKQEELENLYQLP